LPAPAPEFTDARKPAPPSILFARVVFQDTEIRRL
jgi:hypothetical protein